ncbi:hypothetical protein [Sandaracinobacteroides saxicola]|uniref:Uncharacterized protein n=1 Tax=Sandaracinobacteroides saxicola TaxID=2759707 RepID=A0A7G5IJS2_9SPHN|nr:hypothetical protein [Sandaracinobacteroides saxicola]QMW23614.1 hypothetical protein H3309_03730 [Sandaracinobacteroides saxicola]
MRKLLWIALGIGGLLWSGLAWLFYWLAGSGQAAVNSLTRFFELNPASTQWLADTLAVAGPAMQVVVVALWLVGMALLLLLGWLVPRLRRKAAAVIVEGRAVAAAMAEGQRPVLDPLIRERLGPGSNPG